MKKELVKTIKQLCNEIGTAAAAEMKEELTENLAEEYDKREQAGMDELNAYRDVLKNIDKIRDMLESLPQTDEEIEKKERDAGRKNLERILGKISTCMWLCTVIAFFLFSITNSGTWRYSWLLFLWSSIGQILLNMVKKVNRGKPLKKVMKSGLSGIFWLGITIVYFLLSFASGAWRLTWLIFLVGALLQTFLGMFLDD